MTISILENLVVGIVVGGILWFFIKSAGKTAELNSERTSPTTRLSCEGCGAVYDIGSDAFLVTDEDLVGATMQAGGQFVKYGRARGPDLAMAGNMADKGLKARAMRRASEARASLERGEPRTWVCEKCHREQHYPAKWG